MQQVILKTFAVPPVGCNCSILGDPESSKAVIVDPGGNPEQLLAEVRRLGLTIVRILHTHAHFPATRVIPGHGQATRIGLEREYNPFVAG